MKKLFASLLAATMVAGMAVSAFAAPTGYYRANSGEDFTLENAAFKGAALTAGAQVNNGTKIYYPIVINNEDGSADYVTKASDAEKLTVRVKDVRNGKYVSAKIVREQIDAATPAKEYCVEVKVDNYFETIDDELEFDLELRNKGRLMVSTKDDDKIVTTFTIGKEAAQEGTLNSKADKQTIELDEDGVPTSFPVTVETIVLKGGKSVEFEVKAAKQDDVFVGFDKDIEKDIVIANPDADLDFFAFPGNAEFDFTGTLTYYVDDDTKEYFFYEIVDGKPVATNAKYNAEDSCFELRTRKLGKYVVSDKALVLGAEEKPAEKPAEDKPATTDKVVGTGALA